MLALGINTIKEIYEIKRLCFLIIVTIYRGKRAEEFISSNEVRYCLKSHDSFITSRGWHWLLLLDFSYKVHIGGIPCWEVSRCKSENVLFLKINGHYKKPCWYLEITLARLRQSLGYELNI
jgi:hypothetical protein